MSAAHVRRGAAAQTRPRKAAKPNRPRSKKQVDHARINKAVGIVFGLFVVGIAVVVLIALDVPAKAARGAGAAIGEAGFTVNNYQVTGLHHMARAPIDAVVSDELHRSAESAGIDKAPQTLVSVGEIRDRLLQFGWIKDARVSRRLPDTLVIDVVERTPAALWQDSGGQLALIDRDGVVLDRVPVDKMPDLPLLIGAGANGHAEELGTLMAAVPTLKPQLASATWVGGRRWDLNFQTGEIVALPEGAAPAEAALVKFAKADKSTGLLGHGMLRFDLRIPGKMIVRLPHAPAPITGTPPQQEG